MITAIRCAMLAGALLFLAFKSEAQGAELTCPGASRPTTFISGQVCLVTTGVAGDFSLIPGGGSFVWSLSRESWWATCLAHSDANPGQCPRNEGAVLRVTVLRHDGTTGTMDIYSRAIESP